MKILTSQHMTTTPACILRVNYSKELWLFITNGVARMLKKLHQWRCQNAEKCTHIKERPMCEATILCNCVPFQNGNFS